MSRHRVFVIPVIACMLLAGCAKPSAAPPVPGVPSTGMVEFVAYADAAVTAAEVSVGMIKSLSPADQALAQVAFSDLGQGITCVYNLAISGNPSIIATAGNIGACLSSVVIPAAAGPQLSAILRAVFASVQAFATAYSGLTVAQQTATLAAITPASTSPVMARLNKLTTPKS
jgi:hypothetical protein